MSPLLQAPIHALDWFNARHPFSHNDHFHGWVLRGLPDRRCRALDVGCGEGLLAQKLVSRFNQVDAADNDEKMRRTVAALGEQRIRLIDSFDAADGPYDLITMVSALHHLELAPALHRVADLLAPAGRLSVVGMARPESVTDAIWVAASASVTPALGLFKHPIPTSKPRPDDPFPVRTPEQSIDEIREAAATILPGSVVRRRVPFRYTLEWTAPAE